MINHTSMPVTIASIAAISTPTTTDTIVDTPTDHHRIDTMRNDMIIDTDHSITSIRTSSTATTTIIEEITMTEDPVEKDA